MKAQRRSVFRTVAEWLIWTVSRLVPKNPRSIVIQSLTDSEDGALAIEQRLLERGHSVIRLTGASTSAYRQPEIRYCKRLSIEGIWSFARCGVLFTTHAVFGGVSKVKRQRNVLLWHGEPVKPVGLLHNDRAIAADLAPVCSEIGRRYRCLEFRLSANRVPIIGAPRNDRMLLADRRAVRHRLGWPAKASVWLWLPTYRGPLSGGRGGDTVSSYGGLPFDDTSLAMLDEQLAHYNITLVLKPHPMTSIDNIAARQGLRLISQAQIECSGPSLYEVLAAADGLVTDASSVWIDYLLTQRPIIFAFPDIEEYRQGRGLNLEPYEEWAPGPFAGDWQSLVKHLDDFNKGIDRDAMRRAEMLGRFHTHIDAGSTDRLLDALGL